MLSPGRSITGEESKVFSLIRKKTYMETQAPEKRTYGNTGTGKYRKHKSLARLRQNRCSEFAARRHGREVLLPRTVVLGCRADELVGSVAPQLLDNVGTPATSPGDYEKWREHENRDAHLEVGGCGEEVCVWVHFLFICHQGLDAVRCSPEDRLSIRTLRKSFRDCLEDCVARIAIFVDAMTKSHDELLATHHVPDFFLPLLNRSHILEHVHHRLVRPAMQRPTQSTDRGSDARIGVGEC